MTENLYKELHNMYSSRNVVKTAKPRKEEMNGIYAHAIHEKCV